MFLSFCTAREFKMKRKRVESAFPYNFAIFRKLPFANYSCFRRYAYDNRNGILFFIRLCFCCAQYQISLCNLWIWNKAVEYLPFFICLILMRRFNWYTKVWKLYKIMTQTMFLFRFHFILIHYACPICDDNWQITILLNGSNKFTIHNYYLIFSPKLICHCYYFYDIWPIQINECMKMLLKKQWMSI